MKTSLGLFYIKFMPIDPFHLNLTHWTFKHPHPGLDGLIKKLLLPCAASSHSLFPLRWRRSQHHAAAAISGQTKGRRGGDPAGTSWETSCWRPVSETHEGPNPDRRESPDLRAAPSPRLMRHYPTFQFLLHDLVSGAHSHFFCIF